MKQKHPHVVNVADAEIRDQSKGSRFAFRGRRLGLSAGGNAIGCSHFEVPPGKTAFPYHYHCANEEALYVLSGEGELRIGADVVKISAGDYAVFPPGPENAHALKNTGTTPLLYLCLSTQRSPEIVGYPDSKKFGCVASQEPAKGLLLGNAWVRLLIKEQPNVDYYEGETID